MNDELIARLDVCIAALDAEAPANLGIISRANPCEFYRRYRTLLSVLLQVAGEQLPEKYKQWPAYLLTGLDLACPQPDAPQPTVG